MGTRHHYMSMAMSHRSRWRRRGWLVAVVVAMAVVAIAVVAWVLSAEVGITVTDVRWLGSNPCGGLTGSTTSGFRGAEGGQEKYTVTGLVNRNATGSCTISSVSSMVPGFTVLGGSYPLTIPAGGSANLTVTLGLPGTSFDGPLSLQVE